MSLWSRFKAWRDKPWYVEIEQGTPVILDGALKHFNMAFICSSCHRNPGEGKECREYESGCHGESGWHPVGSIRVESEGDV